MSGKSVKIYFREGEGSTKEIDFSLTEAVQQVSSTVFTLSNMDLTEFLEDNEDVFFFMRNSFNDFYEAITLSA